MKKIAILLLAFAGLSANTANADDETNERIDYLKTTAKDLNYAQWVSVNKDEKSRTANQLMMVRAFETYASAGQICKTEGGKPSQDIPEKYDLKEFKTGANFTFAYPCLNKEGKNTIYKVFFKKNEKDSVLNYSPGIEIIDVESDAVKQTLIFPPEVEFKAYSKEFEPIMDAMKSNEDLNEWFKEACLADDRAAKAKSGKAKTTKKQVRN